MSICSHRHADTPHRASRLVRVNICTHALTGFVRVNPHLEAIAGFVRVNLDIQAVTGFVRVNLCLYAVTVMQIHLIEHPGWLGLICIHMQSLGLLGLILI